MLRHSGLLPQDLVWMRAESESLPPIELDRYSGVLLGGSAFNISDALKSSNQTRVEGELEELIGQIVANDFPFLGLCYGVGALTINQGGTVDRDFGESVGATEITLTQIGQLDPLLAGLPERFHAFVGHKEACKTLPTTAVLLATGEDCPVQMYRIGRNAYVTQFHPELDAQDLAARMRIYQHAGYFAPEELDDLIEMAMKAPLDGRQHLVLSNFVTRYARED